MSRLDSGRVNEVQLLVQQTTEEKRLPLDKYRQEKSSIVVKIRGSLTRQKNCGRWSEQKWASRANRNAPVFEAAPFPVNSNYEMDEDIQGRRRNLLGSTLTAMLLYCRLEALYWRPSPLA
ncbi:MAG: hypothetical protein CYPHOPRED_004160, partial [Cyphobasidiales sp. Tagirdzhanova-0007]